MLKLKIDGLSCSIKSKEILKDITVYLSQNVVETFIDRIEVFNDESVKIRFTFEDVLKNYEAE